MVGILSTIVFTIMNTMINQYFSLQKESTNLTDLTAQSHRISNVLRSSTEIEAANDTELVAYAFFSPNDIYVSRIRYYVTDKKLKADVIDMTANPPIGSQIPESIKTYTILDSYLPVQGIPLFEYLNSTNQTISQPISDLSSIKAIRVNLAVAGGTNQEGSKQAISVAVSLRNRKSNL